MTLPLGYRVVLDPARWTGQEGRLLVGGSPLTVMRLGLTARDRISNGSLTVGDQASAVVAGRLVAANLAHPDVTSLPEIAADELTVVVPVRDRVAELDRCLARLETLRVIVVDDGSLDPAALAAVVARRGAELVVLATNVGPAAARNAGLARVATPYVAFVDSDVETSAEDLLFLARHFADEDLVLVGPRIVGRTRSARPRWFERYDAAASSLDLGVAPGNVRPGAAVAYLPSACLVGRTDLIDGFAEEMRVGEDVDLVWRLIARGHRVAYEPSVTAGHDVRTSISGWLGRKFAYGSSGAALAARHGSHVAPAVLSPALAAAAAAVLARQRWAPALAAGSLCFTARSIHRGLPSELRRVERVAVSFRLAGRGLSWTVRQEAALLLRHWWPVTLVGGLALPGVRRAAGTALVVDAVVALRERREEPIETYVLLVARRLDDLAYGAGLWWGVARAGSLDALRPRRWGSNRPPTAEH